MSRTRLEELYPNAAVRFALTEYAERCFVNELADHGWSPGVWLFAYADDLTVRAVSWREPGNLFLSFRFSILLYKFRAEYHAMAGRKPKESRAQRAKWVGFLDYRLNEDQLSGLDEWSPPLAEVWEKVDALLSNNYRVTLSYNANFKVASCTIMDDDPARPSGGYGVSSSDVDGAGALKAALYKHFVVLEGSWATLLDQPLTPGRRG